MDPASRNQSNLTRRPNLSEPSSHSPVFAIIVPTFNRPELLRQSMDSVLGQTYPHWLMVICDDCSTADYGPLFSSITDPRIVTLRNPRNGGCNQARNLAIDEAIRRNADYMTLLDDEETLHPRCLELALPQIQAHPDHAWFISNTSGEAKTSTRQIVEEASSDWIDDYCYGKTLRGDKTHVISLKVLDDIRFDGRYRASNMWPFYMPLSARTRIWTYPFASKHIQYLEGGITKTSSRYPRTWLEIYSRFARHAYAISLRPTKGAAYKCLLMELLKTPKRLIYLLCGKRR